MEERLTSNSASNLERRPLLGRIPAVALCVLLCSAVVGAMNVSPGADRNTVSRATRVAAPPFRIPAPQPLASPLMQAVKVDRVTKDSPPDALPILAGVHLVSSEPDRADSNAELLHPIADSGPVPMEPVADPSLFPILPQAPALRTMMMEVTAYCACPRCCGPKAHGITASGHPVSYNDGFFVAADTSVLPFGTHLQIPGYADSQPVEVIDRGGAIKGNRLDVFFPTHEQAKEWGRRWIAVDVLE